jgi:hypothetical protein
MIEGLAHLSSDEDDLQMTLTLPTLLPKGTGLHQTTVK